MNTSSISLRHSLLSLALMAAFAVPGAYAATITVDPAAADSDGTTVDGQCSLREAVLSVNVAANTGDCVADITEAYGTNDTISLPAGTYKLTVTGLDDSWTGTAPNYTVVNTPDTSKGDIDIMKSVRIVGAGADSTIIQWDASVADANRDRIFHVFTTAVATVNVAISGVTITGGRTFEEVIDSNGAPISDPLVNTVYYLRRAGGGVAVGAAANVVQIDPALVGDQNSAGRGGSQKPSDTAPSATFSLTLSGVKVLANEAQGDGAGVYSSSPMTATNLVVSTNISTVNGGGMYNEGDTSITNSTFSGNKAEGGGGIFFTGTNTVIISATTLSGNRAVGGGAVSARSGVTVSMTNSTISGNLADDVGAGYYTNSPATMRFVTIANNIASADSPAAGVGINTFPSGAVSVSLKNVLLSANKKGWDPIAEPNGPADPAALASANCGYTGGASGAITSAGYNLSSDTSCTADLDQIASDKNNVDPKLDVLALNSPGTTQTHALLDGSPALGAGGAIVGVTVDQRGITRDATPDIGAYEVQTPISVAPPISSGGGGGCTVNPNSQFDGGLLGLLAAAMGGLMLRRRRSATRK
jgi:hypothetical protein